ncbi:methylmalonyl-CoA mutase small subunit [Bacillus sp. ISL-35]|uniref:methylmalonyl-CoA mutase family protein n=1 Tax=Bacillus sp. ISL-35 TaxID=2819122 RepID=UPI001BE7F770|nr:methylmalonyl-CoA mutase family protein [Bacillus sp. ISL-35]MBT2677584.1 methylmalonyl-CoA mutase small subunit [Bacillus sp. ISL-35]MBT2702028.1 methylmalonyl-CoA mutase small subunit [Chryseobacterium sp. ISL-80]
MTIENMKAASFKDAAFEDWQKKAAASLKGKPIETLYTHTYEDITLKPLYTKNDLPDELAGALPGEPDYRRGIHPYGYQSESWHIANRLSYNDLPELKEKMDSALTKGQTAISFEVKSDLFPDQRGLAEFFASYKNDYPLSLNAGLLQTPLLAALSIACKEAGPSSKVSGFVAADPVADAGQNGGLPKEEKAFFAEWAKVLEEADQQLPQLKTVLANTVPYHDSGASAVQELAAGISTGVYLLQQLLDQGWDLKKALSKFVFHFAIGSNFFMETAKLRAARILWSKIAEAFGAEREDQRMVVSAETSKFTKTIFDPYVNMLRVGNEAFAAVLGGIQYLHTGSFEEAAGTVSAFSERVARNTQLILKSEAHLEKVADPAGGSWYIESLTNELAEKAWDLFLELDGRGGIYEALKSGWFHEQIAKTADAREQDIFNRKKSIIGTNVYANLSEAVSQPEVQDRNSKYFGGTLADSVKMIESEDSLLKRFEDIEKSFAPLESKRLSQPFEKLRFRANGLEKMGQRPVVGLICLNQLKKHKPRADFISGLLSAGGIHALRSGEIHTVQEALEFIKASSAKQFVISGDQTSYNSFGPGLALEIKKEYDVKLYLAGIPEEKESEWKTAGIQDFLHVRSNAYQSLSSILQEMEVGTNAKA